MPKLKQYHLFISHAWRYGDDYDRLITLLDEAKRFRYKNFSSPKSNPLVSKGTHVRDKAILNKIERKISRVHCVLVLGGMYAKYRGWMHAEIELAQKYNKPILILKPWRQKRIPKELSSLNGQLIPWRTQSIVNEIRKCTSSKRELQTK